MSPILATRIEAAREAVRLAELETRNLLKATIDDDTAAGHMALPLLLEPAVEQLVAVERMLTRLTAGVEPEVHAQWTPPVTEVAECYYTRRPTSREFDAASASMTGEELNAWCDACARALSSGVEAVTRRKV